MTPWPRPRRQAQRASKSASGPSTRVVVVAALALAILVGMSLAAGCGSNQTLPSTAAQLTSETSRDGRFIVSYSPDLGHVPINVLQSWTVHVATSGGEPVDHANITVSGGMPDMGHGLPTAPRAHYLKDGAYSVQGLEFTMPGRWVVTFTVDAGGQVDRTTFNLQLQ
jgi:YtkA-like